MPNNETARGRMVTSADGRGYGGSFRFKNMVILLVLLLAPALAVWRQTNPELWPWFSGYIAVMSLLTFALYAWDKRRSRKGGWRTTGNALHLVAFLGGWPGAYLAQSLLRHKSSKLWFQIPFWLIVAVYQYVSIDWLMNGQVSGRIQSMF